MTELLFMIGNIMPEDEIVNSITSAALEYQTGSKEEARKKQGRSCQCTACFF